MSIQEFGHLETLLIAVKLATCYQHSEFEHY